MRGILEEHHNSFWKLIHQHQADPEEGLTACHAYLVDCLCGKDQSLALVVLVTYLGGAKLEPPHHNTDFTTWPKPKLEFE